MVLKPWLGLHKALNTDHTVLVTGKPLPNLTSQINRELIFLSFFKYCNYLFLERGEGGIKGEKHQRARETSKRPLTHPQLGIWPATQACALTGNRTSDPLVHRSAPTPLSHCGPMAKVDFSTAFLPHYEFDD